MPPTAPTNQTPVILERIDAIREDICQLKGAIESLERSYQEFVIGYTRSHEQLEAKVMKYAEKIDDHEARLRATENLVKPLVFQSRVVALIGSVLLTTVLGFLFMVLTNQVTVGAP